MLILVSQLLHRPIIDFEDATPVGILKDPIIDPDNGKIVGYFFGYGLFALKQGVLMVDDIVGYDELRVIVQNTDVDRVISEEPKLKKVVEKQTPVLGAKVITESGTFIGRANDLLIDTDLHMVVRYYVHGLMHDRIIAAEQINRIEKHGIIVDDTATGAGLAEAEPSV